jgi:transcriptional regulator with GAF, ATPase, and Fis domain
MALSAWLDVFDLTPPNGSVAPVRALQSALEVALPQGGITLHPVQPGGFGIFLFDTFETTILNRLLALAAHSTVLAIFCAPAPLPADAMWAVLEAGATDLLLWPPGQVIAEQVLARLQRWDAVQCLMESDTVQSCLVGNSPAWRTLLRSVVEVAAFTDSSVLITGETGTGKDLIAQLIHRLSRVTGELTVLDCTTLSPELAGSEMFGHERGAFTGALNARDGAFATADGGVLFLDEVGELPLPLQAQLLRVLQERKYKRVGSNTWQPSRFRLVCATNRDLESCVADASFRADLYYRIAGWRCRPPPLRERQGDILPLATHFLRQLAPPGTEYALDPAVREYLLTRDYPGNVRDLRQTVARIWHRHSGPGPITIGDVPPDERLHAAPAWPDHCFAEAIQRAVDLGIGLSRIGQVAADLAIRMVLEQEGDNNQRAALRLGVTDRALQIRRKAQAEANGGNQR